MAGTARCIEGVAIAAELFASPVCRTVFVGEYWLTGSWAAFQGYLSSSWSESKCYISHWYSVSVALHTVSSM